MNNNRRKVIDATIDIGYELEAIGMNIGYQELMHTDMVESTFLLQAARDHFNTPYPQQIPLTVETLIENMDEANVVYGVLHSVNFTSKRPYYTKKPWEPLRMYCSPDYVKSIIDKYPYRFKGVVGIDPTEPREKVYADIDKYIKGWGFAGIKLMPFSGWYPSDKELMYPIYERCVDLDCVVCIESSQSGWPKTRIYSQTPLQLDEVACDFPELKMHIVCGGERKVWHNEALSVCFRAGRDNVMMDTCPSTPELWTSYVNAPDEFKLASEMIPNNVMWGSEYPFLFPMKRGIDALDAIPGISEEFKNKLFYENAARFYGFE